MSNGRRTERERERDRQGIVLTLWQPLPELGDAAPDPALCGRCDLPLGSRSYELTVGGVDRAGGLGVAPHRWTIRSEALCRWCYVMYLEAQVGSGARAGRAQRGRDGRDD